MPDKSTARNREDPCAEPHWASQTLARCGFFGFDSRADSIAGEYPAFLGGDRRAD